MIDDPSSLECSAFDADQEVERKWSQQLKGDYLKMTKILSKSMSKAPRFCLGLKCLTSSTLMASDVKPSVIERMGLNRFQRVPLCVQ